MVLLSLYLYFASHDEFLLDDQLVANVHVVEFDLVRSKLSSLHVHVVDVPHVQVVHHELEFASLNDYRISLIRDLYDATHRDLAFYLRNHDVVDHLVLVDLRDEASHHDMNVLRDEVCDHQISFRNRDLSYVQCASFQMQRAGDLRGMNVLHAFDDHHHDFICAEHDLQNVYVLALISHHVVQLLQLLEHQLVLANQ